MADGEVALSTAFADGAGIIVSAGTGSIAYARDPAGQLHRAGGYGWQLGDEGGGDWLGRRALGVPARAQDGRGGGSPPLPRPPRAPGPPRFARLRPLTAAAAGAHEGGARSEGPAPRQEYAAAGGPSRPRPCPAPHAVTPPAPTARPR